LKGLATDVKRLRRSLVTLGCFVLLQVCSLSSQVAPVPRYRVLKTGKSQKQTVDALNALAGQGYRLILPSFSVQILRLETIPPEIYTYIAVDVDLRSPVDFVNRLNQQGKRGYRWVPELGLGEVMEKKPHPINYEYESPSAQSLNFGGTKLVSSLVSQGYHPLSSLTASFSWQQVIFEREKGAKSKLGRAVDWKKVQIAEGAGGGSWMQQVGALAKSGYRYLCPWTSQKANWLASMMQKCDQDCGGPYEYRYFDLHDIGQFDEKLSAQGREGFRVLPQTLESVFPVLEHDTAKTETYTYHVLPSKDLVALEQELNGKEQEGYEPIGYLSESVLLEKVSQASRQ